jgi:two-component system sensor histidine kinase YesM
LKVNHLILLIILITVNKLYSQVSNSSDLRGNKKSAVYSKTSELEWELNNNNYENLAQKYYELSEVLYNENNLIKAEDYIKKAITLFEENGTKKQLKQSLRLQAKIKEGLNKKQEAIASYESASGKSDNAQYEDINKLDAKRLKENNYSKSNELIKSKIKSIKSKNNAGISSSEDEIAQSYKQLAINNVEQKLTVDAIDNYSNAVQTSSNNTELNKQLNNELAELLEKEKKYDKAIEVRSNAISKAEKEGDEKNLIIQKQEIAKILLTTNNKIEAEKLLLEAFNIAIQKNHSIEAKNSSLQLIEFYKQNKKYEQAILISEQYLNKLENIIKNDSSLIDKSKLEITDAKIKNLEKEKTLKDELLAEKNAYNYILIFSLIIAIILSIVIIRYAIIVNRRNKKISLQSLRREMNPHFIFNSLNSVNQFIAQNNELEANKFLSSYSTLMRNVMDNSNKDFLTLSKEIEQIEKYLQLEHLRFKTQFEYQINVSETIDTEQFLIPNMLLQPHLENAIWHGLRYKPEKGKLEITFIEKNNIIEVLINDDGIGIEKSKNLKTANQKLHQSIGLKNIDERINLLNSLYNININYQVNSSDIGTQIKFVFPKLNKVQ